MSLPLVFTACVPVKNVAAPDKGATFRRSERRHGEFRRIVQLPATVEEDKIVAKYENGILTITIFENADVALNRIPVTA